MSEVREKEGLDPQRWQRTLVENCLRKPGAPVKSTPATLSENPHHD